MAKTKKTLKVIPLGGLGEIGKNITAFEYGDDIVVVDCGLMFPEEEMLGIDLVIPDITYLVKNADKVRGIVLTHGHEDHIGALPYILKQLNVPVYGTRLTLGLVGNKLAEHGLTDSVDRVVVNAGEKVQLGCMQVEFIRSTHSIADSVMLAIHTPVGVVIHSGDYKVDYTPIGGEPIDFARLAELGRKGVLLLMAESTNVERPGYTMSESTVGEQFEEIFMNASGRVLVATFASNVHRVQQVINAAVKYGRKVAICGRSMVNVANVAMELGYMTVPEGVLVDIDQIDKYPDDRMVIITTGSQGEPMSALSRIAYGEHRKISIRPNDLVVLSSTPIPGNEKMVSRVVNELFKRGAQVIYEALEKVHVSGHACQEELKLLHVLTRPKFFMPVHGEFRHLKQHAALAKTMGMKPENIFLMDIGKVLEVSGASAKITGVVPSGKVLVDGIGVGDVGSVVLRDRKHLSEDGIIITVITIDSSSGEIVAGPDIISRGFVYVREAEDLMDEARDVVREAIESFNSNRKKDWSALKNAARDELRDFLYEKTKRKPMILPIIMEI